MNLHETDTVLTLWTAQLEDQSGDFLCILARTEAGKLKAEYRFRYSAGPGFNDNDRINRYEIVTDDTPEKLAKLYESFRSLMQVGPFRSRLETPVNGPAAKLSEAFLSLPNWSVKIGRAPP